MMSVWLKAAISRPTTLSSAAASLSNLNKAGPAIFRRQQPFTSLVVSRPALRSPASSNLLFARVYSERGSAPAPRQNFRVPLNRPTPGGNLNAVLYILSGLVFMIGASYAAVPLYKMFCEAQGLDVGTEYKDGNIEKLKEKLSSMKKAEDREIKVRFVASTSADLLWKFEPSQSEVTVVPGETALAFFKAKNLTERSIIGIASYTILPYEAAIYFTKIQCFCFEEQRLEPGEEVDMPVFFYIDEEYANDPKLVQIDEICLSYMFFESKGETTFAGTTIKPFQLQPNKA